LFCQTDISCDILGIYFRFGGTEYPPMILFKVFIKCGENGVKYYSGKKMIRAASKVVFESYEH
jgi:hypothetical protein